MKRSHAPSALAAKKKVREKQLGIDSDSESDGMVCDGVRRTHNESAFDRFVSVLKKIARKTSGEAHFEEDDDLASAAPPPSEDKENDGMMAYFGVYYSQRQSSRHFDAALAAEGSGEGVLAFLNLCVRVFMFYGVIGLVIVKNAYCHLLNLEAKEIGRAPCKNLLKFVERDLPMSIGNKELQVRVFVP